MSRSGGGFTGAKPIEAVLGVTSGRLVSIAGGTLELSQEWNAAESQRTTVKHLRKLMLAFFHTSFHISRYLISKSKRGHD